HPIVCDDDLGMDVQLLGREHIIRKRSPLPKAVKLDVLLRVNPDSPEPLKDRVLPAADAVVLELDNQPDAHTGLLIYSALKAWHQRNENGTLPIVPILIRSDNAIN